MEIKISGKWKMESGKLTKQQDIATPFFLQFKLSTFNFQLSTLQCGRYTDGFRHPSTYEFNF